MTADKTTHLRSKENQELKRSGFLEKLDQLAAAWEFDPQEALYLEIKSLRKEVEILRSKIEQLGK